MTDVRPIPDRLRPERVAHYRVLRKLGEGGMGVVYAAHDERLHRDVAIKMIHGGGDAAARERLWREARAAAAVSHPNVCQLYEVGEEGGELFLAMELLEGESLAARIARGPMPPAEATEIVLPILAALEPLHRRGVLHRDLKPSNVFLTAYGVKLLDFGLARPFAEGMARDTQLTRTDVVVGTPHYLAPEQLASGAVDARSDLFAVGAILYELLTGRQAFTGRNVVEVFHAVMHEEPPPLGGSAAVANLDRVLRRVMSKKPERRHPSAEVLAGDLRAALVLADSSGAMVRAQPLRRLVVLPFRILRPDPDTDFLAFSLPDAISSSLAGLDSIVVRSSLTAGRLAHDGAGLEEIARQADVDIVLTGTLLRSEGELRVATQLIEAPGGTLLWSQTSQAVLGDIFQLQDGLSRRIVESLAVPLSARDRSALGRDAPADPRAYELYLRANQMAVESTRWEEARDLYLECLRLDPGFAPAWARLGRVHRVIAQYATGPDEENYARAQEAFRRALELSPDLPSAHHLYTNVEVDLGRAQEAMVRLVGRAAQRRADAEVFAGLVQTCRYCGLLDASIAAYEEAARLDPAVRTSVNHAYLMRGDYARSIETNLEDPKLVSAIAYDLWGRPEDGVRLMREAEERALPRLMRGFVESTRLLLEGRTREARAIMEHMEKNFTVRDPCATYYFARGLARGGRLPSALAMLRRSVEGGFTCFAFATRDPWLEPLRGGEEFRSLLRTMEARERQARAAFIEAGGDRVLPVGG